MPYPNTSTYPSSSLYPGADAPSPESTALVMREYPPTRLNIDIATPAGMHYRWAQDDPNPDNVPADLSFSSTMPGGYEQADCVLLRKSELVYPDLVEFSTVTVRGVGDRVAWQGRLETAPASAGDTRSISPGAVGFQAALTDRQDVRIIYVDSDQTAWTVASSAHKQDLADNRNIDVLDPQLGKDPTNPALILAVQGTVSRTRRCEAWYDAKGLNLARLYFAWKKSANINTADTNWSWIGTLSDNDVVTNRNETGNLRAAGPATAEVLASGVTKHWARTYIEYDPVNSGGAPMTGGDGDQVIYRLFETTIGVYGDHGLPLHGIEDALNVAGVYASDVIGHVVSTWAPALGRERAGFSTIEDTSFVIRQLAFTDPVSVVDVIDAANTYEGLDWWVDTGPTFNYASPDNHGKRWRARVAPSALQETGPQVDRMFNGVIVPFTDRGGTDRTVEVLDWDPSNPVTIAGLFRCYLMPAVGMLTPADATQIANAWLADQRQRSTAGQATFTGYIEDDHGIMYPAWAVQAGDQVSFTDAQDTGYRRIVKAAYTDSSRSCQVDLDSPPSTLASFIQRTNEKIQRARRRADRVSDGGGGTYTR